MPQRRPRLHSFPFPSPVFLLFVFFSLLVGISAASPVNLSIKLLTSALVRFGFQELFFVLGLSASFVQTVTMAPAAPGAPSVSDRAGAEQAGCEFSEKAAGMQPMTTGRTLSQVFDPEWTPGPRQLAASVLHLQEERHPAWVLPLWSAEKSGNCPATCTLVTGPH